MSKLQHTLPDWVPDGSRFHIRIRVGTHSPSLLTLDGTATEILRSAALYHANASWYLWTMVLMPDHLHAILSFPFSKSMSRTIGAWKRFQNRNLGIEWQENYFDHRLRDDREYEEKADYIAMNPVRVGLCDNPEQWPWTLRTPDDPR